MSVPIKDELYARALGWEAVQYIKQNLALLQNIELEIDLDALKVLDQLRLILDDNNIVDLDCFEKIERIVQTFHAYGLSTTRHDWG